jgi:hypothetical protein
VVFAMARVVAILGGITWQDCLAGLIGRNTWEE